MEEAATIEETLVLEWTTAVEALDTENIKELFDIRPSLLWTPLLPLAHLETDFSHFIQRLKDYKLLGTSIRPLYALHHILFDYGVPDDEWAPERIELVDYILKNTKDNELNTCFWGTEENTVIHLAYFLQQDELIQQLKDHGAVSTIPNKNGLLPTIPDAQPQVRLLKTKPAVAKDKALTTNASDRFKRLRELAESPNVNKPTSTERQNSTRRYFRPGHLEERKRRVLSEEEEAELEKKTILRQKEVDQLAQRSAVKNNPLFKKFEEQKQQKELEAKRTPSLTAASAVRDRKKLLGAADQIRRTSRVINSLKDRSYVSSSVFRQAQEAEAAANSARSGKSLHVPTLAQLRGSPITSPLASPLASPLTSPMASPLASPNVSDNEEVESDSQKDISQKEDQKKESSSIEPEVQIVVTETITNDNKQEALKNDDTLLKQRTSGDNKRDVTEDELESLAVGRLGDREISSNLKLTKKEIEIASNKVKDIVNVHEHLNDENELEIYTVGKKFEVWKKEDSEEDIDSQKIASVKKPVDSPSSSIQEQIPSPQTTSLSKETLTTLDPSEIPSSTCIDNENPDKERSVPAKKESDHVIIKKDVKTPDSFSVAVKDKVQLVNEILAANEKNAVIANKEKPETSYAYKNISVEKLSQETSIPSLAEKNNPAPAKILSNEPTATTLPLKLSQSIKEDKKRNIDISTTVKDRTEIESTAPMLPSDDKAQSVVRSMEEKKSSDPLEIQAIDAHANGDISDKEPALLNNMRPDVKPLASDNSTVKDRYVEDSKDTLPSVTLKKTTFDKEYDDVNDNIPRSLLPGVINKTEETPALNQDKPIFSPVTENSIQVSDKASMSTIPTLSSNTTDITEEMSDFDVSVNEDSKPISIPVHYTTEEYDSDISVDEDPNPIAVPISHTAEVSDKVNDYATSINSTKGPTPEMTQDTSIISQSNLNVPRKMDSFSSSQYSSDDDDDSSDEYSSQVQVAEKQSVTGVPPSNITLDQSDTQSEYMSDYEYDGSSFLDDLTFEDDIVTKASPMTSNNEKPTIHIEHDTSDDDNDVTDNMDSMYDMNEPPKEANHVICLEINTNKSRMMIEDESDEDEASTPTLATFQKPRAVETSDDEESRKEWNDVYHGLMSNQQEIEFEDDILEQHQKTLDPSRVSISSDLDETSILQTLSIQNEQRLSKWTNKRQSGSQRNHWSTGIQDAMKRESMLSKGGESVAASEASSDQWYDPDDEWNEQEEMRRQSMLVAGFHIPPPTKEDDYTTDYYYNGGREDYNRHSDSSINTNSETYSYKNSNSTENTNLDEDEEDERKHYEPYQEAVIQEHRPLQHDVIEEEEEDYYSTNLHTAPTKTRGESSYYHGGQTDNEQEEGEIVVFMGQFSTPPPTAERQHDPSYYNTSKPLTNFSTSTLSVNQREDDEVSLIKVPSRTVAIAEVGNEQEDVPHDPNHPRVEDISHYMNELPAFSKHTSESAVRGGSAFDTSAVEGGLENESVVMKRAISTTQVPGQPVEQSRGIPNAHEINSEFLAVASEKRPSQDDRKISMSSLEVSSFGKMYIGVSGAHNMLLPLPKEITYVRCVISDGEYEYMSRYEVLGHQILMDYECVIDTRPGMIITVSLHVRPDYHVKPRTGWSRWFTSIRKQKEHLSGYVHPEDGAIGQTRFAVDHMVPGCYKKTYEAHFDCFNSWYARTTRERARREQFGDDEDFLKIVGKLNVEMLYLPVSNPSVQVPRSLRECDLTLKIRQWHDTCWQSGFLSTRRQGLKIWERHYYRLIGSQLIGYTTDGGDRQVWDHYNMSDVIRLSAAADKVIVTLLGDSEEDKVFGHESIHADNHKGFFRLAFPDYHLDCVSDDLDESEEWVKTLKSMIGRVPLRLPFSD